ncbi:MAG: YoaK family protein [Acidocella sp.]|nr:YoaK family protein [Acidocella sp.]
MNGLSEPTTDHRLERILGLTALAAGAVDIISFARLGGVFASAMTGNLAFMGLYLARFSFIAALASLIALLGFIGGGVAGTLLGRKRAQFTALRLLLGAETCLLAATVWMWFTTAHDHASISRDTLILLLSLAMGVQSIIGKRVNLSNIPTVVFTSTLTNIVIGLTDMLASKRFAVPPDTKRQSVSFLAYFAGALVAGLCVFVNIQAIILIPVLATGAGLLVIIRNV